MKQEYLFATAFEDFLFVRVPAEWVQNKEISLGEDRNYTYLSHHPSKRTWRFWLEFSDDNVTQCSKLLPESEFKEFGEDQELKNWQSIRKSQLFWNSHTFIPLS